MHYANTLKSAVACAFLGLATVSVQVSGAHAQPQFDTKLARALADKAARTLGDLRLRPAGEIAAVPVAAESVPARSATDVIETGSIRTYRPRRPEPKVEDAAEPTRWLLPRTDIRVVYAG